MLRPFVIACLLLCAQASANAAQRTITLDPRQLDQWTAQSFVNATHYSHTDEGLLAEADASASGYLYRFDPALPPDTELQFSWQLLASLDNPNERIKAGDDFAGRVYIIQEGRFFWQTQALNYVWSAQSAPGTVWTSPYSRQVRLWSVNGPDSAIGQWQHIQRRLADDWQTAFGSPLRRIDGIAFMTDSDDTGGVATMLYGPITLLPAPARP
ncbi:DUF3047 domain-containing protein [Salinispirillum sp. LH 10-3-1]|uniref:DUF3047 domain-containing protein n=1 Tax=Salinispirillum sp. LH 10-3-1 TaxID=2952525 RepID=A0AB38YHA0_9GAMM